MQNHAVTDCAAVVNNGVGVQDGVLAHRGAGAHVTPGKKPRARADHGARAHVGARFDDSLGRDLCAFFHHGLRVNKACGALGFCHHLQSPGKPGVGVCADNKRPVGGRPFGPHGLEVGFR